MKKVLEQISFLWKTKLLEVGFVLLFSIIMGLTYQYQYEIINPLRNYELPKGFFWILVFIFLSAEVLTLGVNNNKEISWKENLANFFHQNIRHARFLFIIGLILYIFIDSYSYVFNLTTYLKPDWLMCLAILMIISALMLLAISGYMANEAAFKKEEKFHPFTVSVTLFTVSLIFLTAHASKFVLFWCISAMSFSLYLHVKWVLRRNYLLQANDNETLSQEYGNSDLLIEVGTILFITLVSLYLVPNIKNISQDFKVVVNCIFDNTGIKTDYYTIEKNRNQIRTSLIVIDRDVRHITKDLNMTRRDVNACLDNINLIEKNTTILIYGLNYENLNRIKLIVDEFKALKYNYSMLEKHLKIVVNEKVYPEINDETFNIQNSIDEIDKSINHLEYVAKTIKEQGIKPYAHKKI